MKFTEYLSKNNFLFEYIADKSKNEIKSAVLNSKSASSDNIFTAIKGFKTDGHIYITDAYNNGCRDFIVEDAGNIHDVMKNDSTIIKVPDSRKALADISSLIYDFPYNKLKMIGITGSKGKSSVTNLSYFLIKDKLTVSMFSTIKNIVADKVEDAVRTTMESNELNDLLNQSVLHGREAAVVEVSSHAVTLKRVENIEWDIGIFTSFSRDHLDLYGTMENYFQAKLDFFRALNNSKKKNKSVFINMDDPKGIDVAEIIDKSVKVIKIGQKTEYDYFIKDFSYNSDKMIIKIIHNNKELVFETGMKGVFNVTNIALSVALALELGIDCDVIKNKLSNFCGVEGRFEIVKSEPYTVIVDYAHTPYSLENILLEGKKISRGKIITVFGCTGDRDKEKRSIMGEVAALNSDLTFITNDDPYSEKPESIASAIESGFKKSGKDNYRIILERKDAVREALKNASKGDVVIIAGMGHQKKQVFKDKIISYNDKETIIELLKEQNKS